MKIKKQLFMIMLTVIMMLNIAPMHIQAIGTLQQDSEGYYLIYNENDLFTFSELVNNGEYSADAKLMADITMTGSTKPWEPIAWIDAEYTTIRSYSGTFDGQGYTIRNLYLNDSSKLNGGLFGRIEGGTVRNVIIADSFISVDSNGGAIAGDCYDNVIIEGCGNLNTTVTGGYDNGGIVGFARGTTIRACWNTGTIEDSSNAGGIVGFAHLDMAITGCWNKGTITSDEAAGGMVARASGDDVNVSYCYNDGYVVANSTYSQEGAIIGCNNSNTSTPIISNCNYTELDNSADYAFEDMSDYHFTNVAGVTDSMLPTGGAAYLLNQGLTGTGYQFYQNLDNNPDAYPVLNDTHGVVYRGYKMCSDNISYANSLLSATIYHSGIDYETDHLTIREVCTNPNCTLSEGLGHITLHVEDAYYTGNSIGASVEGSFNNGSTYKVTYNGMEAIPGNIGTHTVKLTVYENDIEKKSVTTTYQISYLPAPSISEFIVSGHSSFVNGTYWFNAGSSADVSGPEGYEISVNQNGTFGAAVTLSENDNKCVYLRKISDGTITDAIDFSGILKYDTSAPAGIVQLLSVGNFWTQLVDNISFDIFLKEPTTITITAQDDESGVKSIEYYVSDEAMTLSEVESVTDWSEYNGGFIVTSEDSKKFVCFVRITDYSGNVSYLSTNGAEYDTSVPVIEGIENGKTYYTTQKVTVTDKNLDTVTLNGNNVTGIVTLEGNKDVTYILEATDKAGNFTTITVTMKPIRVLAEVTDNLGHDNVTSADAPALKDLIEILNKLIADPDTSDDGEKETLEQHRTIAESLLRTIEEAEKEANIGNKENIEDMISDVKDITSENVTPKDKSNLKKAETDLKKALADKNNNYTEDEKKTIQKEIAQIEDAITVLENVENVTEAISQLPESVKLEDESEAEKVMIVKETYDALTDYEKSLLSENIKKKLNTLITSLTTYDIIEGDGSVWAEGSDGTIIFTVNGAFSKFVSIKVDDVDVDKADYEVKAGSTIITLKASYLDTLEVGEHTITVIFSDGSTKGTFDITAKPDIMETDGNSGLWPWIILLLIVAGVYGVIQYNRKKNK